MNTKKIKKSKNNFLSTGKDLRLDILIELTRDTIRKARKMELDKYGVHPRRYALLLALQDIGDTATPTELSRRLIRKRHSVSELLSKMEKDGLIKKVKDLARKNMIRIILTKKGRKLSNLASRQESIHIILSSLNKRKLQRLKILLEKVRDSILKTHDLERSVPQLRTYNLDYDVFLLLIETTDEINRLRQAELNRYGIHHRRAALLRVMKDIHERATAVEIANRLGRERNSVSELMNKMERDGLVKKVKDLENKKMIRFLLTEKGRKAYDQSNRHTNIVEIISTLSKKEHQELESNLLTLYNKALKEIGINGLR
ncbi:MarR family winged helix-turn-helix transcriptional regulator [Thermodesulfobacteriota bacterium]